VEILERERNSESTRDGVSVRKKFDGIFYGKQVDAMTDATAIVLKAMKSAGKAVQAGEVEKMTGLSRKEIDKAMKALKESGAIVSPKRCFWEAK
jgi:hypothetical protein